MKKVIENKDFKCTIFESGSRCYENKTNAHPLEFVKFIQETD